MFPLAGKTAGPNGLKFVVDTHGEWGDISYKKLKFFFKYIFSPTGNAGSFS